MKQNCLVPIYDLGSGIRSERRPDLSQSPVGMTILQIKRTQPSMFSAPIESNGPILSAVLKSLLTDGLISVDDCSDVFPVLAVRLTAEGEEVAEMLAPKEAEE